MISPARKTSSRIAKTYKQSLVTNRKKEKKREHQVCPHSQVDIHCSEETYLPKVKNKIQLADVSKIQV
jgi:hypothetical protein